jgi:LytR cell envelope-related transcriptional attenuator
MARGPVRVIIIVAAVAVGALVIANGFPRAGERVPRARTTTPTTPAARSPTPSQSPSPSPRQGPRCQIQGVHLGIYNGTETDLLAADTAEVLTGAGYTIDDVDNAPATPKTILYYRTRKDKVEATCLREDFFKGANIAPLPDGTEIPDTVQVGIILGADFASRQD